MKYLFQFIITSYILPQNMDIASYILPQNMDEMTMVHFTDYKAHFENLFTILCKCPVLSVVQLLSLTKNLFYLHNFQPISCMHYSFLICLFIQHLLAMQDSLGYNRSYIQINGTHCINLYLGFSSHKCSILSERFPLAFFLVHS